VSESNKAIDEVPSHPLPPDAERVKKLQAYAKTVADIKKAEDDAEKQAEETKAAIVPNPIVEESKAKEAAFEAEQKAQIEKDQAEIQASLAKEEAKKVVKLQAAKLALPVNDEDYVSNLPEHHFEGKSYLEQRAENFDSESDSDSDDE